MPEYTHTLHVFGVIYLPDTDKFWLDVTVDNNPMRFRAHLDGLDAKLHAKASAEGKSCLEVAIEYYRLLQEAEQTPTIDIPPT